MGTEPIAAARCKGSWPRLSLTRAEAPRATSLRAVSTLFLEAVKWSAVWDCREQMRKVKAKKQNSQICSVFFLNLEVGVGERQDAYLSAIVLHVDICVFPQEHVHKAVFFT